MCLRSDTAYTCFGDSSASAYVFPTGGKGPYSEEGLEIDVDKKESMFALKGDQVEIINFIVQIAFQQQI